MTWCAALGCKTLVAWLQVHGLVPDSRVPDPGTGPRLHAYTA